jgi:hypothetical protein
MTPAVALRLHEAAYDLHRKDGTVARLATDDLRGEIVNLRQDALLGTIGGPVFEARVETESGEGVVRFFLTRAGLELMEERELMARKHAAMLN